MKIMNIGIFDSGIGGLTVLKNLFKKIPQYNYIYLADNKNVPYGEKSEKEIFDLTKKGAEFLFSRNCKLVITACNTITAVALREYQDGVLARNYPDRKVLGVVLPAVEVVLEKGFKKVGVIGTEATIKSGEFRKKLFQANNKIEVFQKACPLLACEIEKGNWESDSFILLLNNYLKLFKKEKIEALILGCTHFGLIKKQIAEVLDENTKIIDEGEICVDKLRNYLDCHPEIDEALGKKSEKRYYVTDKLEGYRNYFEKFLGKEFREKDELELVRL